MAPPFNPRAFVVLAQELASTTEEEVRLRTAVGRVYYGLFLVARVQLGVRARRDVQREVISAMKRRNRTLADQLDALRRLRVVADYQLTPENSSDRNWKANWQRAQALANRVLPLLEAM